MTCNCKSDLEARLLDRAKEQLPDSKNHEVRMTGYALVFNDTNGMDFLGSMPVEIQHTVVVKKTGCDRVKKDKTNFIFTYCPFCGVRYKAEKGEAS